MSEPASASSSSACSTGAPRSVDEPAAIVGGAAVFQTLDRAQRAPYSVRERLLRALWSFVNLTVWRLPRGWGWRRWLLRCFGAKVGNGTIFRASARVFHPWLFEIGEFSTLGPDVVIYNLGPVSIGSHTTLSHQTYVCAGTHDYTLPNLPLLRPPVRIGSGVWVGAQAFVGPGVTVSDNCVVGARAVVSRDVPPATIVGGNPARVLKARVMKSPPY